jgi:CheY-like chemotaxis protein
LQQVLWNLLANAVKFTPKGGQVQIRVLRVNSSVDVAVSDTGRGIEADFLPFVFDRFRQADEHARELGGLGLGLAICRHLVELHGGTIRAESGGLDLGATFVVRLPVMIAHERGGVASPHRALERMPEESARLEGVRVLIVEDERDARELIVKILEQEGARPSAVSSVAEALDEIRIRRPQLIVSDVQLAGEDGYALIRKLRALEPGRGNRIPAIALTAHAKPADRLKALSAGFQMHIAKPVEPEELVVAIANLAAGARADD